ncbi:hypothetical protein R6Q59_014295 [Mikania micrantha]
MTLNICTEKWKMDAHCIQILGFIWRIPVKIGDLKSLSSFEVSHNRLSGELPVTLSRLNFLSSFNVSYNNLTGRIPSGTQLQSFNEFSFFGNKLCGDPLTEICETDQAPNRDQEEDDESHGVDWDLIISTLTGFIAGFWLSHISHSQKQKLKLIFVDSPSLICSSASRNVPSSGASLSLIWSHLAVFGMEIKGGNRMKLRTDLGTR